VTYGFRGEALAAICKISDVTITTKTNRDVAAMTYPISNEGVPSSSTPSHLPKGTTITLKNIFKNLPVRKQYASSPKKMVEVLKRVEVVVKCLAVIHPQLRVTLTHNKSNIWQKNSVNSLKQSFMQSVGLRFAAKMEFLEDTVDEV